MPLIERRAQLMNLTRHKALVEVIERWCGESEEILALRPQNWPVKEIMCMCAGCKTGVHCLNKLEYEELDHKNRVREKWVCKCPDCVPDMPKLVEIR